MAVEPQVQQFIDFIRDEMPRRIKTNPNSLPDAEKLLVSVSGTLEVIYKTLAELDIAIKSDVDTELSNKEPSITAGSNTQYWRGDKTFQTLDADAVPETVSRVYLSPEQKTVATQAASSSQSGYLTSADWSTFNGKQNALSDVITADTYGSSTQYPVIKFNAKGIATEVTLQTVPTPTFTDATFKVQKNGSPSITASWSLTALTASRVHTYPDKAIDFGNLSFIATTNSNNLSGTNCHILGGSGNTVSGTDVVLLAATGVSTTKINWSPVVIESSDSNTGNTPLACLSTTTCVKAVDDNLANSGSVNLTTDGGAVGTANTPRAWIAGSGFGATAASTSIHEVEFDLLHGIEAFGLISYGAVFGVRKVAVYTNSSGTVTASSVQTIGTDITIGTANGTLTMSVTIDTTNNRVVPTVTLSGAAGSISLLAQAKIKSRYSRR